MRDLMRIADTLSIDILNAHGGIGVSIPMPRLFEGCTSNEWAVADCGRFALLRIPRVRASSKLTVECRPKWNSRETAHAAEAVHRQPPTLVRVKPCGLRQTGRQYIRFMPQPDRPSP
ncbi:unnamed protein product [Sphagnum balticum]